MLRIALFSFCIFVFSFAPLGTVSAADNALISTPAPQAIVIDYDTGAVLFEKNADEQMPTSSMSKVMTMYMVFEALKRGDIALDDTFLVSEKAWRKGGSKMFVEVDKRVKIEDLIRGVIVQSGNDASIVLAEGLGGTENSFVHMMNAKAADLGMDRTNFSNASGWPDPDHYSTARDLATLAYNLVQNFPEYYDYYSETEYTYNNITQKNRNPLLYREIGADGIKTGHTEDGGFGLIGSGEFQGRRVIMVINGLESNQARAQESAKLLSWGLKRFENKQLFKAGDVVEQANVTMGKEKTLPLIVPSDIVVTVPKISADDIKISANYEGPLLAPIESGQTVGELTIEIPHIGTEKAKLEAANAVEELGFFAKSFEKAKQYVMEKL